MTAAVSEETLVVTWPPKLCISFVISPLDFSVFPITNFNPSNGFDFLGKKYMVFIGKIEKKFVYPKNCHVKHS
jgi:hypothetical protein